MDRRNVRSSIVEAGMNLVELVDTHTLPVIVKVIEGFCDQKNEDLEYGTGDVLTLVRVVCPTVTLSFHTRNEYIKLSVRVDHPARFRVLPCDPDAPTDEYSLDRARRPLYRTAEDLARVCPYLVKTGVRYTDPQDSLTWFGENERLRIQKLLFSEGKKLVECHPIDRPHVPLLHLPMDCVGNFEHLDDPNDYTLHHLAFNMPRARVLRLAPFAEGSGRRLMVPGMPDDFDGLVFLERPTLFVEEGEVNSPKNHTLLPTSLEMLVSPRDDDYTGPLGVQYSLNGSIRQGWFRQRGVVMVGDWKKEESCALRRHRLGNYSTIVMWRLDDVPKVLCEVNKQHVLVPCSYCGVFERRARDFHNIESLLTAGRVRVKCLDGSEKPKKKKELHGTQKGQVLESTGKTRIVLHEEKGRIDDETEVLILTVYNNGVREKNVLQVPLYFKGRYKELLGSSDQQPFTLDCLGPGSEYPIHATMKKADLRLSGIIPGEEECFLKEKCELVIKCFINETCLLASKMVRNQPPQESFHVPIRCDLSVSNTEMDCSHLNASDSPLSVYDSWPEVVTEETAKHVKEQGEYSPSLLTQPPPIPDRRFFPETFRQPVSPPPKPTDLYTAVPKKRIDKKPKKKKVPTASLR